MLDVQKYKISIRHHSSFNKRCTKVTSVRIDVSFPPNFQILEQLTQLFRMNLTRKAAFHVVKFHLKQLTIVLLVNHNHNLLWTLSWNVWLIDLLQRFSTVHLYFPSSTGVMSLSTNLNDFFINSSFGNILNQTARNGKYKTYSNRLSYLYVLSTIARSKTRLFSVSSELIGWKRSHH